MSMKGPIVVTAAKNRQWAECTACASSAAQQKCIFLIIFLFTKIIIPIYFTVK